MSVFDPSSRDFNTSTPKPLAATQSPKKSPVLLISATKNMLRSRIGHFSSSSTKPLMTRPTRTFPSTRLLLLLVLVNLLSNSISPTYAGLTIGGVSSTSSCYDALNSSSGDDNLVDKTEYVTFINILTDDYFTYPQFSSETNSWANLPVSEFYQLPMDLQMNFNQLACGGEFISCLNAYIVADGTAKGETPTDQQTIYLYDVCSSTDEKVKDAKAVLEASFTASPVASPEVVPTTSSPSNVGIVEGGSTESPVASPVGVLPTTSPSIGNLGGSGSPTLEVDLSNATTYYSTLYYQILVPSSLTAEAVLDPTHQMNMDLVWTMNGWSTETSRNWNENQNDEGKRSLRGRDNNIVNYSGRGLFLTTAQTSSDITNVTSVICNNNTVNEISSNRIFHRVRATRQWIPQEKDSEHCLEITQGQTYYLYLENDTDGVASYISTAFEKDVIDGSYFSMIPEPSKSEIRMIYPSDNNPPSSGDYDKSSAGEEAPLDPAPSTLPKNVDSIVSTPDNTGTSKTPAIAAGVSVALIVAIIGLFVARRKMRDREAEFLEDVDDDFKRDQNDDDLAENGQKNTAWNDDDSSSSDSYNSDSSSSSSHSVSSGSTSGSSRSYYSNSGSTSGGGTSATGGKNGPKSVSASDTDSYTSHPKESPNRNIASSERATARVAMDSVNRVYDSMDSGSSVDEASLVEEAGVEEIDSDSDHGSQHSDDDQNHEYEMNVDLTDAEGLEIPHDHYLRGQIATSGSRRSKESSMGDDSSAGSSGWESSVGDSSSTNTESVESFDPNLEDMGSSTISKTTPSSDNDDIDELLVDKELLPGTINPAINPVVQPRVSMLPVDDIDDDDDSAFMSDGSDNSSSFAKRTDAAPLGHEIKSAIEQGDWTAVGATAAILASKRSSTQIEEDTALMTEADSFGATHAAEMNSLVDTGNWSGIVAVAARYADDASIQSGPPPSDHGSESSQHQYRSRSLTRSVSSASVETADESSAYTQSQSSAGPMSQVSNDAMSAASSTSYTGSYASYSGTGTFSGTGTYSGTGTSETGTRSGSSSGVDKGSRSSNSRASSSFTSSRSPAESTFVNQTTLTTLSSASENPEEKQRMHAYRAEVEALVRRVVPDEIDNVDAIMVQFAGREEELIATLRGMQEKTIAQRARAAVQRSAKKEASRTGGRGACDDHTASSEDPSSVRSSTQGSAASASGSVNNRVSMASADGCSITEEFAEDSSYSGSDSESSYSSGSDNETEERSRSEYSESQSSGYSEVSPNDRSTVGSATRSSGFSADESQGQMKDFDYHSNTKWRGAVDFARNTRHQAGEDDLD